MKGRLCRFIALIAPVLFLVPLLARTQHAEPSPFHLLLLRIEEIKPDRIAEWETLQAELNQAIEKAGVPGRAVWEVVRGDLNTFYILAPAQSLGQADIPHTVMESEQWASWQRRLRETVVSQKLMILQNFPELGYLPDEDATPRVMWFKTWETGEDGSRERTLAWAKKYWSPGMKAAPTEKGTIVARIFAGGRGEGLAVVTMRIVESWDAFFPAPMPKYVSSLGEDWSTFGTATNSLFYATENVFLEFRPKISGSNVWENLF